MNLIETGDNEVNVDSDPDMRAHGVIGGVEESAKRKSRQISQLYLNPYRRSQLSVEYIRWLRHHLDMNSTMRHAAESLRMVTQPFERIELDTVLLYAQLAVCRTQGC